MKYEDLRHLLYNLPTKYKEGLTSDEIESLLNRFNIDKDKFLIEVRGNTGIVIENESLSYRSDILRALNVIINNYKYLDFD